MALDERDYMRERARKLVERHYYGKAAPQERKKPTSTAVVALIWIGLACALWLAFKWAGYR